MTRPDLDDAALRDVAVAAACGRAPFDLLLTGGLLADMATGELREADIGLVGPLIASVHPRGSRSDAARSIALEGAVIAPGLIDMHMHIESSMMTPRRYAEVVVPQGTTTVCWDPHEVGNVAGLDGVRWAVAAAEGLDLRVLTLAPSCVPSAPGLERAGADLGPDAMAEMLSWPGIHGVAEVMDMRGVLDRSPRMRGIIDAGLASGKLVCGHARGLSGGDLQGFAAAGIGSDHEITSGEDILEKLRAGFTVELRGSHDYVLPGVVAELMALPRVPQTLTLCTDDVFPDDLVEKGGMIDLLRRLVSYGLPAIEALRAATLNAAMRLGRADLGLVAPGRRADLIVLEDLQGLAVRRVFASGREVARDGVALAPVQTAPAPAFAGTVRVPALSADDFILRTSAPDGAGVEVQTIFRPRFTEWRSRVLGAQAGQLVLPEDVLMMAVIHRHGLAAPTPVLGLLEDWGCWTGALATTVAHDSHNLTVFGRDPADMAAAANALIGCDGGMAVARGGAVTALLPLPVAGLLSDAPPAEIARAFQTLRTAADAIADWAPPLRTFKAVVGASLACNPGPHVTDMGLACGTTGEFRPLTA
ncbi:adenine deaminase [Plastorhodobacter daqingensis]|uniref:Adenine deaminase n=1 Tax=Plastorhodobacter daqingensis TaxID=1387281 RepID=A0ABW2UKU1_9RHOB